uniref:Uncharacterized protein n=1 Tax=Arundo donax TaxID=35708 RepID=A0A0A9CUB6_ARUDO
MITSPKRVTWRKRAPLVLACNNSSHRNVTPCSCNSYYTCQLLLALVCVVTCVLLGCPSPWMAGCDCAGGRSTSTTYTAQAAARGPGRRRWPRRSPPRQQPPPITSRRATTMRSPRRPPPQCRRAAATTSCSASWRLSTSRGAVARASPRRALAPASPVMTMPFWSHPWPTSRVSRPRTRRSSTRRRHRQGRTRRRWCSRSRSRRRMRRGASGSGGGRSS